MVKNVIFTLIFVFLLGYGLVSFANEKRSTVVSGVNIKTKSINVENKKQNNEYGVWLNWWSGKESINTIEELSEKVVTISPLWFYVDEQAKLQTYPVKEKLLIQEKLIEKNIKIIPTIGNDFDPIRIKKLFEDNILRDKMINDLYDLIIQNNYEGVDLDWEQVSAEDRLNYVYFVKDLKEKFANKKIFVTVHAKTGVSDWEGSHGHDLNLLSLHADKIRIMAYDYHYADSKPGPTTPLNWLNQIVNYAINNIEIEKIVVGLPLYGYEWKINDRGESITYQQIKMKQNQLGFVLNRDHDSGVLNAKYSIKRSNYEVWIEDKESIIKKIKQVNDMDINQFVFWVAGGEDLSVWENLP